MTLVKFYKNNQRSERYAIQTVQHTVVEEKYLGNMVISKSIFNEGPKRGITQCSQVCMTRNVSSSQVGAHIEMM